MPVRDVATEDPPAMSMYYRNTIKKFQANYIGQSTGKIEGVAKLVESKMIDGMLTNGTGQRLEDVYLAFRYPNEAGQSTDWLLWMDKWEPGVSLDLSREFYMNDKGERGSTCAQS